jgi:2-C-methyl-D-erythritol 4-phosphate cytidylyltransferase
MKQLRKKEKVVAIVPAAGLGKRFGPGTNKPFQTIDGKPLITLSLQVLQSVYEITEIIPVFKLEDMEQGQKIIEEFGISKIQRIAPGGKERQDSVYNGLKLIEDKNCLVLIHDGVRPLIEKALIENAIKEMLSIPALSPDTDRVDGVVLAVPVKDTIKETEDGIIKRTLKRSALWAIQTPQVFLYGSIAAAYDKAMNEGFYSTDDAALIERYGGKIKVVMGSYLNLKITTPEDICIAEALLKLCA